MASPSSANLTPQTHALTSDPSGSTTGGAAKKTKKKKILTGDDIEVKFPSGSHYKGGMIEGKMHGFGVYTYMPSNDIYSGEWKDGQKHGKGSYTTGTGDVFNGHFVENKRTGFGKQTTQTGDSYEGGWLEDEYNGFGVSCTVSSGSRYEGEWVKGQRNGKGTIWNRRTGIYEGQWKNGKEHGVGIWVLPPWAVQKAIQMALDEEAAAAQKAAGGSGSGADGATGATSATGPDGKPAAGTPPPTVVLKPDEMQVKKCTTAADFDELKEEMESEEGKTRYFSYFREGWLEGHCIIQCYKATQNATKIVTEYREGSCVARKKIPTWESVYWAGANVTRFPADWYPLELLWSEYTWELRGEPRPVKPKPPLLEEAKKKDDEEKKVSELQKRINVCREKWTELDAAEEALSKLLKFRIQALAISNNNSNPNSSNDTATVAAGASTPTTDAPPSSEEAETGTAATTEDTTTTTQVSASPFLLKSQTQKYLALEDNQDHVNKLKLDIKAIESERAKAMTDLCAFVKKLWNDQSFARSKQIMSWQQLRAHEREELRKQKAAEPISSITTTTTATTQQEVSSANTEEEQLQNKNECNEDSSTTTTSNIPWPELTTLVTAGEVEQLAGLGITKEGERLFGVHGVVFTTLPPSPLKQPHGVLGDVHDDDHDWKKKKKSLSSSLTSSLLETEMLEVMARESNVAQLERCEWNALLQAFSIESCAYLTSEEMEQRWAAVFARREKEEAEEQRAQEARRQDEENNHRLQLLQQAELVMSSGGDTNVVLNRSEPCILFEMEEVEKRSDLISRQRRAWNVLLSDHYNKLFEWNNVAEAKNKARYESLETSEVEKRLERERQDRIDAAVERIHQMMLATELDERVKREHDLNRSEATSWLTILESSRIEATRLRMLAAGGFADPSSMKEQFASAEEQFDRREREQRFGISFAMQSTFLIPRWEDGFRLNILAREHLWRDGLEGRFQIGKSAISEKERKVLEHQQNMLSVTNQAVNHFNAQSRFLIQHRLKVMSDQRHKIEDQQDNIGRSTANNSVTPATPTIKTSTTSAAVINTTPAVIMETSTARGTSAPTSRIVGRSSEYFHPHHIPSRPVASMSTLKKSQLVAAASSSSSTSPQMPTPSKPNNTSPSLVAVVPSPSPSSPSGGVDHTTAAAAGGGALVPTPSPNHASTAQLDTSSIAGIITLMRRFDNMLLVSLPKPMNSMNSSSGSGSSSGSSGNGGPLTPRRPPPSSVASPHHHCSSHSTRPFAALYGGNTNTATTTTQ